MPSPQVITWRQSLICIGVALFFAGFAVPPVGSLLDAIREMDPAGVRTEYRSAYVSGLDAVVRDRRLMAASTLAHMLALPSAKSVDIDGFRRFDPNNGLFNYLQVLPMLREGKRDVDLAGRIRDLASAPAAALHLEEMYRSFRDAMRRGEVAPRVASAEAMHLDEIETDLYAWYRPVLRDLADRMISLAAQWREAGRADDARAAAAASVRLLSELALESPRPGMVLLACERLPRALGELAQSSPPDAARCKALAGQVDAVRNAWHGAATFDQPNVIPWTGDFALARPEHERLLRAFFAAWTCIIAWGFLLVVCLILLIPAARSARAGIPLRWSPGWQNGRAIVHMTVPLIAGVAVLLVLPLPFAWLTSITSAWLVPLVPLGILAVIGLGSRAGVRAPAACSPTPSTRTLWVLVLIGAIAPAAVAITMPLLRGPAWIPRQVQMLRGFGAAGSCTWALLILAWWILGHARRRRSRAALAVTAAGLLGTTLVGLAVLGVYQLRDAAHERAFVAAAEQPLRDRAGAGWDAPFKGAAALAGNLTAHQ